jgi:hypothetical protein
MYKFVVLVLTLFITLNTKAQLKIGADYSGQVTSTSSMIPFKQNDKNSVNLPTFTSGTGVLATYDSYTKNRGIQLRIGYSSHNQKFIYRYQIGDQYNTDPNKKLFDYLKFALVARKFGYISRYVKSVFFFGPQFDYLLQFKGGIVAYIPKEYYDLPATSPNIYYKKYSIDAVVGYSLEYAIHKNFDVFASLRLDYGLNNIEQKGATSNGVQIFNGSGAHQITYALQFGGYYVFHRKDHLLLPGNSWRYRVYKKKKIKGRK